MDIHFKNQTPFTSSKGRNMPDLAAISFAALLVLILVVVLVQFMLWLRVKYEIKSDQATWKGVIEDVKRQAEAATQASTTATTAAASRPGCRVKLDGLRWGERIAITAACQNLHVAVALPAHGTFGLEL